MPIKHPLRIVIAATLIAWCFDQLFWGKVPGISIFIFTLLVIVGGLILTRSEAAVPASSALPILPLALGFSGLTAVRTEPGTLFWNQITTLGCLATLAVTWLGGAWYRYRFLDYLFQYLLLGVSLIEKPLRLLSPRVASPAGDVPRVNPIQGLVRRNRPLFSIAIGLLIAFPIVAILGSLLASADLIFAARLEALLSLLRLEYIPEYFFRIILILVLASLLTGAYLHSLVSSREERMLGPEQKLVPNFLGWLEAATVLACVNLLFAFFVAVQFGYFFGGQSNVTTQGYTYAEYARKGFGELVIVAGLSLLLYLALSAITRRDSSTARWSFSGLGVGLMLLVGVILVSAFQRLNLYESVYGFTRLRIYTHVFMVWLGLLLAATVAMDLAGVLRYFPLACVVAWLGFGVTLNAINVDALIVNRNVTRAQYGFELDVAYLASLSADAVPALFQRWEDGGLDARTHRDVGAVLVCWSASQPSQDEPQPWQSYRFSSARARNMLGAHAAELSDYTLVEDRGWKSVKVDGRSIDCASSFYWD